MTTKAAQDLDGLFETTEVNFRGHSWTFRELSSAEYDDCVKLSTSGEGEEATLDSVQVMRWMIIKGSVEPKLTADSLGKLPLSVVTELSKAVNDLHWAPDTRMATPPDEPELDEDGKEKRPNA